jgi:hypothetical protein
LAVARGILESFLTITITVYYFHSVISPPLTLDSNSMARNSTKKPSSIGRGHTLPSVNPTFEALDKLDLVQLRKYAKVELLFPGFIPSFTHRPFYPERRREPFKAKKRGSPEIHMCSDKNPPSKVSHCPVPLFMTHLHFLYHQRRECKSYFHTFFFPYPTLRRTSRPG